MLKYGVLAAAAAAGAACTVQPEPPTAVPAAETEHAAPDAAGDEQYGRMNLFEAVGDGEAGHVRISAGTIEKLLQLEAGWPELAEFHADLGAAVPGAAPLAGRITYVRPAAGSGWILEGLSYEPCETGYTGETRCGSGEAAHDREPRTGTVYLTADRDRIRAGVITAPDGGTKYRLAAVGGSADAVDVERVDLETEER